MSKILLLFEGSIRTTGTYNFLEEINTNYTFLNIVTAAMGTQKIRLSDYIFPIGLIILGFDTVAEYNELYIYQNSIKINKLLYRWYISSWD